MRDNVEDLLERAGRVRTSPVDPAEIWATGRRRRRTRHVVQAATVTLVAVALAVPVGVVAYRELSTPGVDVADTPPDGGVAPADRCPSSGAGPIVDRAQGATSVARAIVSAGAVLPTDPPDRFEDDDGTPAEAAINQLSALGVLEGTSRADQAFAPEAPLTRGQLASLLVRSYELSTGDRIDAPEDPFEDDNGSPHEADTAKATTAGLLGPVSVTAFGVDEAVGTGELEAAARRLAARLEGRQLPTCHYTEPQN